MKRFLGGLLLLGCSLVLTADEPPPPPNQLTPQESEEGWLLLFDGESTFGWRSPNDSKWTIYQGMLAPQADKPGELTTTTAFREYDLSVEFISRSGRARVVVGEGGKELQKEKGRQQGVIELQGFGGNNWTTLRARVRDGEVLSAHFEMRSGFGGGSAKAGRRVPEAHDVSKPHPITLTGNQVIFKNIKLKPLGTKPLFNGRDLAGWKEYAGKKSQFAVTTDRLLTIKNGPGDLQTEGSWSDFLLQLECRTNGNRLNSGVFFRCRPGEYQQGYEAQIHNGFLEGPTKEYTVEEYDPKTNELKDKHKVKSAAMDYGTGAIYRRVPARKQVAKDQQWFTMTVVAEGRHIATWVNGVQTVDWTDNRPLKDNARNGCRLEAGPISLQGHDPTTNLSFRNIRLADMSPQKRTDKPEEKKDRIPR